MTLTIPEIDQSEVDEIIDLVVADLRGARAIIDLYGHEKQRFGTGPGSPACIVGALLRARGLHYGCLNDIRVNRAVYALLSMLGADYSTPLLRRNAIYEFNDHEDTTKEDVLGLFDVTIKNLTRGEDV